MEKFYFLCRDALATTWNKLLKNINEPSNIGKHCNCCNTHYRLSTSLVSVQPSETAILAVTIANTPLQPAVTDRSRPHPYQSDLFSRSDLLFAVWLPKFVQAIVGRASKAESFVLIFDLRSCTLFLFFSFVLLFPYSPVFFDKLKHPLLESWHLWSSSSSACNTLSPTSFLIVNCLSIPRYWHVSVT